MKNHVNLPTGVRQVQHKDFHFNSSTNQKLKVSQCHRSCYVKTPQTPTTTPHGGGTKSIFPKIRTKASQVLFNVVGEV